MRALTAVASAKAGVRVQRPLQFCLECRSKSKKCDKQLTFIDRVGDSIYFRKMEIFFSIAIPTIKNKEESLFGLGYA
jgi:hypothetical protein